MHVTQVEQRLIFPHPIKPSNVFSDDFLEGFVLENKVHGMPLAEDQQAFVDSFIEIMLAEYGEFMPVGIEQAMQQLRTQIVFLPHERAVELNRLLGVETGGELGRYIGGANMIQIDSTNLAKDTYQSQYDVTYHLLAHELTHGFQQLRSGQTAPVFNEIGAKAFSAGAVARLNMPGAQEKSTAAEQILGHLVDKYGNDVFRHFFGSESRVVDPNSTFLPYLADLLRHNEKLSEGFVEHVTSRP